MQEVFEKIIGKLEAERFCYFLTIANTGDKSFDVAYEKVGEVIDKAIEIVKQEAELYREEKQKCGDAEQKEKESFNAGYNQAIDDFAKEAKKMADKWWGNCCINVPDINEIAENLKKV